MDVLTWLRAQADRVLGFALVAAGAVALVIGYEKAADTRYLAEQITVLISGGLGGIFCLGAGATLLVCADIRDEWRKLDRIEAVLVHMSDALGLPPPPGPPESTGGRPGRLSKPVVTSSALVVMAVGGILVATGWQASASTTVGSKAVDAAGWSSAGVVVAGLGAAALIVSLKRAVRIREATVLSPVALYGAWQEAGLRMAVGRRPADRDVGPATTVRYAAGLRHFHRPGCAAVTDVATDGCERAVAAERLAPCPLCEP